jgi:pilus assembly protein Flp/PilA
VCAITLHVRRFLASEDGPTTVEYAVMLALIIAACLTIVKSLGQTMASGAFEDARDGAAGVP